MLRKITCKVVKLVSCFKRTLSRICKALTSKLLFNYKLDRDNPIAHDHITFTKITIHNTIQNFTITLDPYNIEYVAKVIRA